MCIRNTGVSGEFGGKWLINTLANRYHRPKDPSVPSNGLHLDMGRISSLLMEIFIMDWIKHQSYGQLNVALSQKNYRDFQDYIEGQNIVCSALRVWNYMNNILYQKPGPFNSFSNKKLAYKHVIFFWLNLFLWMLVHFLKGVINCSMHQTSFQKLHYPLIILSKWKSTVAKTVFIKGKILILEA